MTRTQKQGKEEKQTEMSEKGQLHRQKENTGHVADLVVKTN